MADNIKVVVIGRNYSSRLGMIRAVGMAGYEVAVIKTNGCQGSKDIDAYSKYVKEYLYAQEPDRKELIKVLMSFKSDDRKIVIIPVDDYAASTIDENTDLLKKDFLFPNIELHQGAINHLMDKNYQKQLAKQVGLKVANGWIMKIEDGERVIPSDIIYPVFPKPQISYLGSKTCMKRCSNQFELENVLNNYASHRDCPILLEEYYEISHEYAVLGFSDGKDVFFPAIIQMLESGSGSHHGVTLLGKVLSPEAFSSFLNQLKAFVRELKFTGLLDIDFYESRGTFIFSEMNFRFGASGYAITDLGINLPNLLINCLLGHHYTIWSGIIKESLFVNEKVVYDDYMNGYLSKSDYKRYIERADIKFIQSGDDEGPYRAFLMEKFSCKLILKRKLRQYVKKFIFWNKNNN